jgi:hypothetical protein
MVSNPGRFSEIVHVRGPNGLNQTLEQPATQQHATRSELIRRTLLREVISAGVPLGESEQVAAHG